MERPSLTKLSKMTAVRTKEQRRVHRRGLFLRLFQERSQLFGKGGGGGRAHDPQMYTDRKKIHVHVTYIYARASASERYLFSGLKILGANINDSIPTKH